MTSPFFIVGQYCLLSLLLLVPNVCAEDSSFVRLDPSQIKVKVVENPATVIATGAVHRIRVMIKSQQGIRTTNVVDAATISECCSLLCRVEFFDYKFSSMSARIQSIQTYLDKDGHALFRTAITDLKRDKILLLSGAENIDAVGRSPRLEALIRSLYEPTASASPDQ